MQRTGAVCQEVYRYEHQKVEEKGGRCCEEISLEDWGFRQDVSIKHARSPRHASSASVFQLDDGSPSRINDELRYALHASTTANGTSTSDDATVNVAYVAYATTHGSIYATLGISADDGRSVSTAWKKSKLIEPQRQ
jgi:hypothetical protein